MWTSSKRRLRPVIHLYSICWNEEFMLPFFFRHYDALVDRYVIFDDGSTDASPSMMQEHPRVEVRKLPRLAGDSYVLAAREIHNHAWKESRGSADWVITTAVDELLYTPDLEGYLETCARRGVTAVPALGYQMISESLPPGDRSLLDSVRRGCPWWPMNKLSVFDPDRIEETNQGFGRHRAQPTGRVKYPRRDVLLLLHYKYISLEKTFRRHQDLHSKLGSVDIENKWGHEYGWSMEELRQEWDKLHGNSVPDVLAADYDPHVQHSALAERWWRPGRPWWQRGRQWLVAGKRWLLGAEAPGQNGQHG